MLDRIVGVGRPHPRLVSDRQGDEAHDASENGESADDREGLIPIPHEQINREDTTTAAKALGMRTWRILLRLTRDDPPLTGRSRDQHISATGTPPAAKIVKVPSRGVTWSGSTGDTSQPPTDP